MNRQARNIARCNSGWGGNCNFITEIKRAQNVLEYTQDVTLAST